MNVSIPNKDEARAANARLIASLRAMMSAPGTADPQDLCMRLLMSAVFPERGHERAIALPILMAILRYSVKNVSKERFCDELERALNDNYDWAASVDAEMRGL